MQSSCIKVAIEKEQDNIKLQNAYPLTDKQAEELTPYQFTITNTCNTIVDYTVKLEKLMQTNGQEDKLLNSKYIAVEFNGGQKELLSNYPEGNKTYEGADYKSVEARELIKGTLNGNDTKTYTIKLWMDESVEATSDSMNKSFISKIVVDGSLNELAVYNEPKLHGADPVLGNEDNKEEIALLSTNTLAEEEPTTNDKLIPVIISDNGTITRADLAHDWYNYEEKRWANAVILTEGTAEPEVGAEIPETNIESYFVWIPKYKYKIFDMGKYTEVLQDGSELPDKGPNTSIEIIFGNTDTTDTGTTNGESECESPKVSGQDGQCEVGKWMTHPAFLAFPESKGLWVGKFETGYNQNEDNSLTNTTGWTVSGAQNDTTASNKVIIKPNVYSWRGISVGNAFQTSLAYQKELESHMMKNTEWGAVAYLTNSIYGRCDKEKGTCEEVRINNNSNYVTGYASTTEPNTGFGGYKDYGNVAPKSDNETGSGEFKGTYNYTNPKSNNASTTGNYSGIYDMSGGAWEYVMGVDINGGLDIGDESGLTLEKIEAKYYDKYSNSKNTEYNKRILGDATGEMGPFIPIKFGQQTNRESSWYDDLAWFPISINPWFKRGALNDYGINAGVTSFADEKGGGVRTISFRVVLALN